MKHSYTRNLVYGAVLGALYVLLTHLQNLLLPGTTSMLIQFRLSEMLCVFALYTPAAVGGLSIGCLLYNISTAATLPLDWMVGTVATFLSTLCMYRFRRLRVGKLPLLQLLMPALWNGVLVGSELTVYLVGTPLWLNMLYVAAGEAAVLLTMGTALHFLLSGKRLHNRLFPEEVQ